MSIPKFTLIEKNILWMLVQGKSELEIPMGLSLSIQELDDAIIALSVKTDAENLVEYARRCAMDNKIGGY